MNNGQIFKIKNEKTGDSIYAICYSEKEKLFLDENGKHYKLAYSDYAQKEMLYKYYNDTLPLRKDIMGSSNKDSMRDLTISPTRNVPQTIRDGLTACYGYLRSEIKTAENVNKLIENMNKCEEGYKEQLKKMTEKYRTEEGILSNEDFIEAFKNSLSSSVKSAMNNSTQRGYWSEEGEWEFNTVKFVDTHKISRIDLDRSVSIQKYATPSFTYLEYDDTRCMRSDAAKTKEYQDYIKRYHRPLPVPAEMNEYLSLEDKNTLTYYASYRIELNKNKPLTKEYAKELADKFCGIKKERNVEVEKDENDYER